MLYSKGIKHFLPGDSQNLGWLYFSLQLCGRAWELLTNSLGPDFMSEIGLVQAAMKEVDKISKSNA